MPRIHLGEPENQLASMGTNDADTVLGVYETEGTETTNATLWALEVNDILLDTAIIV